MFEDMCITNYVMQLINFVIKIWKENPINKEKRKEKKRKYRNSFIK